MITMNVAFTAEDSLSLLIQKAEKGDLLSQTALGEMYYNGKGVSKDYCEAEYWFHKAAEQGYARAQLWLGYLYDGGYGVFRFGRGVYDGKPCGRSNDYEMNAEKWYLSAAEQGYADAQWELASYYMRFYGIRFMDFERWLRAASERGHGEAQFNLAMWYDMQKDSSAVIRYTLFSLAACNGYSDADHGCQRLEPGMTQAQLDSAYTLIDFWQLRSARLNAKYDSATVRK